MKKEPKEIIRPKSITVDLMGPPDDSTRVFVRPPVPYKGVVCIMFPRYHLKKIVRGWANGAAQWLRMSRSAQDPLMKAQCAGYSAGLVSAAKSMAKHFRMVKAPGMGSERKEYIGSRKIVKKKKRYVVAKGTPQAG